MLGLVVGCNQASISQPLKSVSVGMSTQEVTDVLGEPTFQKDDSWRYLSSFHLDVISFDNGQVVKKDSYPDFLAEIYFPEYEYYYTWK